MMVCSTTLLQYARRRRKQVAGLMAAVLTAVLLAAAQVDAADPGTVWRLYFTDNLASTGVSLEVTPLESRLLNLLNSAEVTIDAALYDFNRASVLTALLAAEARGVAVRVVADNEARHSAASAASFDALAAAGIPVVLDGPPPTGNAPIAEEGGVDATAASPDAELQSGLMHDKYLIVDGRSVWTGSTNVSDTDITVNHNHALLLEGAQAAAIYQSDFEQMYGGAFGTQKTATLTNSVVISGALTEILFAPQDDPVERVIVAVDGATQSIDFAIFYFTDARLRDALLRAHVRGVRVRGLWDELGAANAASQDEDLCAGGIPILIEQTPGKMHHKAMVVDPTGDGALTIFGSLNWTAAGGQVNNENTVILHGEQAAREFSTEFGKLWDGGGALPCNPLEGSTRLWLPIAMRRDDAIAPQPHPVRIHSIVYNPAGDDAQGEYVSIVNSGVQEAALGGWSLVDEAGNRYGFPVIQLAGGATVRVWVRTGSDTNTDLYWGVNRAVWNNDGDVATLSNAAGSVVDTCAYTGGGAEASCNSTR